MQTLTREGCLARRARLVEASGVDLLIVANPRHIHYLAGLYVTPLALSAWGPNFLLIDCATGASRLVVHNLIAADARTAHVDAVESWTWYDMAADPGIDPYRQGVEELNARLRPYADAGKRIGAEIGWLPLGAHVADPLDITPLLLDMRRTKHPDELALLREAIRVTGAGHRAARQAIRPGATELDVYNAIQAAMVDEAGGAVLLLGDFVSGERAERIGGPATPRVLRPGELMIVDLFPIVNGYRGDHTATVAMDVEVHLSDRQRALEAAVHEALAAGESLLRPGSRAGDVYRAVQRKLAEHRFAEGFTHHAGHGLGLGHPEAPFFVPNSDEVLRAGDVVTLEPGCYGPGFGVRIEHNYLVTPTGFERLSGHQAAFA